MLCYIFGPADHILQWICDFIKFFVWKSKTFQKQWTRKDILFLRAAPHWTGSALLNFTSVFILFFRRNIIQLTHSRSLWAFFSVFCLPVASTAEKNYSLKKLNRARKVCSFDNAAENLLLNIRKRTPKYSSGYVKLSFDITLFCVLL